MTTLREAREKGKLDQFIKEHEADPEGDADQVSRVVEAMAKRSRAIPRSSSPRKRAG
jgi:hypothetical protein